ncbi:MAG: lipid-A-disaccharide synthase, partial [Desulfobacteraceae bacterium]
HMAEAGVEILASSDKMAVVGLTEIFKKLPAIAGAYFKLKSVLKNTRPDLLILVDYPGFNLQIARLAKKYGIQVLYYITPQVWAWRQGRVKKLAAYVERLAVILPFEEDFFREKGLQAQFVGHPLLDQPRPEQNPIELRQELDLDPAQPVIALLPGSRYAEVSNLLPIMLQAGRLLKNDFPSLQWVLALAPTIDRAWLQTLLRDAGLSIKIISADTNRALAVADLAFVTSGTATLETALMEVPMVVLYRMSRISFLAAQIVVRVPFISLTNLVAREKIVPELIQKDATPERLAGEARMILKDPAYKETMTRKLKEIRKKYGEPGCSQKTARMVLEMLDLK